MKHRTGTIATLCAALLTFGLAACLPPAAPTEPVPAVPATTVTPATGLVDGQTVTVTGGGIRLATEPALYQCIGNAGTVTLNNWDRYCDPTTRVGLESGESFSVSFTVRRHIDVGMSGPRAPVDCATTECDIVAGGQYLTAVGDGECGGMASFDGFGARLNFAV